MLQLRNLQGWKYIKENSLLPHDCHKEGMCIAHPALGHPALVTQSCSKATYEIRTQGAWFSPVLLGTLPACINSYKRSVSATVCELPPPRVSGVKGRGEPLSSQALCFVREPQTAASDHPGIYLEKFSCQICKETKLKATSSRALSNVQGLKGDLQCHEEQPAVCQELPPYALHPWSMNQGSELLLDCQVLLSQCKINNKTL